MTIENLTIKEAKEKLNEYSELQNLFNIKDDKSSKSTNDFSDFLNKQIVLFCCRYVYTGKLIEEKENSLVLENPHIIYETGDFKDSGFSDCQSLNCKKWSLSKQSIESYGILENKEI